MADRLRLVRLHPYEHDPTFSLRLYDIGHRERIGYSLRQHDHGTTSILFAGSDFRPSPLHAWDSDATVAALMGFLTLRPGDTEKDYFARYTPAQRTFCDEHAEALWRAVYERFGRER